MVHPYHSMNLLIGKKPKKGIPVPFEPLIGIYTITDNYGAL